jgi:ribosomal protein S18 acetylase RimI-like enzyme
MIHLRQMRGHEFPDFVAYFVPDYAAEISANYDVDIDVARTRAEQTISDDLGQGVDTVGQVLLCIVRDDDAEDRPIGYLWCTPDKAGETVFISDFYIYPNHRGFGFGKRALNALEAMFRATGHTDIQLRVATNNQIAQHLYTAAGFRTTGINMRKPIATE